MKLLRCFASHSNVKKLHGVVSKKVVSTSIKGETSSSTTWLRRQLHDPYVRQRIEEGYKSRSAFKLIEMDDKYHFLKPGSIVVDLGSAPGGWSQVATQRINAQSVPLTKGAAKERAEGDVGVVISVDLQEMEVARTTFIQGDFTKPEAKNQILNLLDGRKVDVILSDMAPPATGRRQVDHMRIMHLSDLVLAFSKEVLREGGTMIVKILQGREERLYLESLKKTFKDAKHVKPDASREDSSEVYFYATKFIRRDLPPKEKPIQTAVSIPKE
eukprot:TRINITY_DN5096_c0_g1_i3.p1 TRINITY_DN5096_c0_g1~~TRINITY_DN5096_c0_g1_i3.p1  ORF type:complete len:271 (-),score=64.47 TRINITY_DN5096_c0_g1_i3:9-821(-)